MSAHVVSDLLNGLWKSDEMSGLASIVSLYHNEFHKFNSTQYKSTKARFSLLYDVKITFEITLLA